MTLNTAISHATEAVSPVSLRRILEKLFSSESIYSAGYIQYIADLIASQPTDQYLPEINLVFLDFDIQTSSDVVTPPALSISSKDKIRDFPISHYVDSVAKLNRMDRNALIWNILVLKIAIYLIALPDIKPQLFKQKNTEHLNTVKILFQRFRLANLALSSQKTSPFKSHYLSLWEDHLNDPSVSLNKFIRYLSGYKSYSNTFEKNLLNDLRIILTYVQKNRPKITKVSIQSKLQHEFLDEDQLIEESFEILKGSSCKALKIEKQLDNQDIRQIHFNPSSLTPLATYTESIQRYVLSLLAKHVQRKDHLLPFSNLYPNIPSISAFLNRLYTDFIQNKNPNKPALILLLIFLTGNKTQEWLHAQRKRVKNLNQRQQIIEVEGQYYLRSKFTLFKNKGFSSPDCLLNQTSHLDVPIPNCFIISLKAGEFIHEGELLRYLGQLSDELCIPNLSLTTISSLIHHSILQRTGNKQLADLLTGIDANKSNSIAYSHQNIQTIISTYISIIRELSEDLSNNYIRIRNSPDLNFGSHKVPAQHIVTGIFSLLKLRIFSQSEEDWVAIFNHYNLWMWHFLLLFTAVQPKAEFPGFLNQFNLKRKIYMASDKEFSQRKEFSRLIHLSDFVVQEIQKFKVFLEHVKLQCKVDHPEIHDLIQQILENKHPLLNIFQNGKGLILGPSHVNNFPELGLKHANWHRHTARAFLSNKIGEPEILALFGHEEMQQEITHPYSSLSITQHSKIAQVLEQMQVHFAIQGIEVDVLID